MNRPFSILAVTLGLAALVAASADQDTPGRGIVFVSVRPDHKGEEIYMIDPETGEESRLTYSGEGMNSNIPQWSPDGTRIAFASNRDDDAGRSSIYVMDGDGTNVRRLAEDCTRASGMVCVTRPTEPRWPLWPFQTTKSVFQ